MGWIWFIRMVFTYHRTSKPKNQRGDQNFDYDEILYGW